MILSYDILSNKQLGFQDPATPIMEGIIDLHHHIFFFLILIVIMVLWLLFSILSHFYILNQSIPLYIKKFYERPIYNIPRDKRAIRKLLFLIKFLRINIINKYFTHQTLLEVIWTIIPAIILVFIAIPSFGLLYASDEILDPICTIQILGHQWYWSYETHDVFFDTSDSENLEYYSYMLFEKDIDLENYVHWRLLDVDNALYVPVKNQIRFIITSTDVLHSWAVPSLGIKLDAIPGRMNQCSVYIKRSGIFYGQCSEICGILHGFMPIELRCIHEDEYNNLFFIPTNPNSFLKQKKNIC